MQKTTSVFQILKSNIIYLLFFVCISFAVFGNSLRNDFAVVDDLPGYVENERIRDISQSISTLQIQEIVYSVVYYFFQINPTPLRVFAVINHAIVGFLLFLIIKSLYDRKTALLATCLFLAHPITTETLNWVSAQFYIVMAMFVYIALLFLIAYRKTSQIKYLYAVIILFAIDIITIRHAWVFILPFVIITFDYFFLEKKKGQLFYKYFISWITPIVILFIIFNFSGQYTQRLLSRSETGKILQNQQTLIPVIQGYPYTIHSLVRLYTFPKDLTMYYDGNKITATTQLFMYSAFLIYISAIIYFFKKDTKIAGILVLLLVFILPVLSPKKITWYITERYLYLGTGFFTTLLAVLISNIEKKYKVTHLAYVITSLIFILYVGRTVARNAEWKNPETLAFATIKTSPYSVRAYNDVAGYYILKNNYNDAKVYYQKALAVSSSFTAVRNLGHLYMVHGFDPTVKTLNYPTTAIYTEALRMMKAQEYYAAAYYLNEVIGLEPNHTDALNRIVELYILYPNVQMAEVYLNKMSEKNIENADTFYLYAYVANTKGEIQQAVNYANKALSMDPNHTATKQLLNQLPVN